VRPHAAERIGRLWRRFARDAGESLTEAVLAMAIFSIVAVSLSGTLTAAVSVQGIARDRTIAEQTAQDRLEYIRRLPYDSVGTTSGNPSGVLSTTTTVSLAGESATITTGVSYVNDKTPTDYLTYADYKKVTITVTRTRDGAQLAKQVTYISPSQKATYGNPIASVQVLDTGSNSAVSGITVNLQTGPSAPRSDVTDSTGSVIFPALTANPTSGSTAYYDLVLGGLGSYTALADDLTPASAAHVQLSPGQTWSTVLRVYKPATIYVVLKNSDGSTFTGNATVTLSCSSTSLSICTGGSQTYSYTGTQLAITSLNSQAIVPGPQYTVSTSNGFSSTAVTQYVPNSYPTDLTSTFSLTGYAIGSIAANVTWGGAAVSGATVTVTGGPNNISLSGTTNSSGQATFSNVPVGSGYTVTATKSGQSASATNQSVAQSATTTVPLALPTGSISSTVTWAGSPVSGATVTLTGGPNSVSLSGTTNSSGQVTIANVPAGSGYTVTATKGSTSANATNQSVTSGGTTSVPLTFPTGTVTATVTWANVAIANVTVSLTNSSNGFTFSSQLTNSSGQVTWTNVPAGSGYTVAASNLTASATVTSGTTTSVSINLPNETLTVNVQDANGNPVGGATVTVTGGPQSGFTRTATTAGNTYASTITGTSGLIDYWRLGESGPINNTVYDSFTGTSATTLASHTGETGASWTLYTASGTAAQISSVNTLRRSGTTGNATAAYYSSGSQSSADYDVQADVVVKSLLTSDTVGVIGRATASSGTSTYYLAEYSIAAGGWQLYKSVSGTLTQLGSTYAQTLTAGSTYTLSLEMLGTSIRLAVNGTELIRATDSSITSAGRAGVYVAGTSTINSSTGLHLDNFTAIPGLAAADSKGTSTGTYLNAPALGVSGAITGDTNTAAQFDGVHDYVSVPRTISGDFTIELWFASTQGLNTNSQWWGNAGLVDGEVGGSTNDFGISLRSDGKVVAGTGNPDTSIISSSGGYNDGTWHQVVFTRQQSTGALKLYVDGSLAGSATSTNTGALTSPSYLNFGRIQAGNNYFAGYLDDVSVYSSVLSSSTISSHYSLGAGTNVGVATVTLPSGNGFNVAVSASPKSGSWTGNVTGNTTITVTVS
jgi:hypothetical protein